MFAPTRRQFAFALAGNLTAAAEEVSYDGFRKPEDVSIAGYSGDAMEPFLSRDGLLLLFNNRNSGPENTDLHWSERVNDVTFTYRGKIAGVNSPALDAVASLDRDGDLYFVSTRSYERTRSTIYRAKLKDGNATKVELVPGVSRNTPGWVNFDAEISADGRTLYFVDAYFGFSKDPQSATLVAATRSGNGFQRLDRNAQLFANLNTARLQYAPDTSPDECELFFTRFPGVATSAVPAIFRSARKSTAEPFSVPQRVGAIQGFSEASTLSPDGRSLYFHTLVNGRFRIRRVTR